VSHAALGQHLLLDLDDAPPHLLSDVAGIERLLREAAALAGATVIHSHFHPFGPGMGITGVLLLRESHISIHTWPEHGFAALDIFMCGEAQPQLAARHIESGLQATGRLRVMARSVSATGVAL
jgi:S-adenosylmethionine decarboxylase